MSPGRVAEDLSVSSGSTGPHPWPPPSRPLKSGRWPRGGGPMIRCSTGQRSQMRPGGSAIAWPTVALLPTSPCSVARRWLWPTTPGGRPATSTPCSSPTAWCSTRPKPSNSACRSGGSTNRPAPTPHPAVTPTPHACSTTPGCGLSAASPDHLLATKVQRRHRAPARVLVDHGCAGAGVADAALERGFPDPVEVASPCDAAQRTHEETPMPSGLGVSIKVYLDVAPKTSGEADGPFARVGLRTAVAVGRSSAPTVPISNRKPRGQRREVLAAMRCGRRSRKEGSP